MWTYTNIRHSGGKGFYSEWAGQVRKMSWQEPHEVNSSKVLNVGENYLMQYCKLRANWLISSSTEKGPGVLEYNKLYISQQDVPPEKLTNSILGCIIKKLANSMEQWPFPTILSLHLEYHVLICVSQYKKLP